MQKLIKILGVDPEFLWHATFGTGPFALNEILFSKIINMFTCKSWPLSLGKGSKKVLRADTNL